MNEEDIFQDAADLAAGERADYLEAACQGQPALRARVERLLASHDEGGFMARPVDDAPEREPEIPEETLQQIRNYKLIERIGEGGFGTVWMAEQQEPVRRLVALKIIKLGMDTRSVIARFREERQALAMMDHPNIARVFDAGAADTGSPYFVMELVRGSKITDFCDHNRLSTSERIAMFAQVCLAIQHAHQKGIIHRDIKPSNILVTLHDGVPVPKVIDFGIAKATSGQRLTGATLFTGFEQFLGTPAYMSPEQAEMSGLDIDTRSDVYSLGVLLYELLTGKTPFDGKELVALGVEGMRRTIRETEPVRPSTKLSQTVSLLEEGARGATLRPSKSKEEVRDSSRRLGQIKELVHLLRGDLDWIVMKCLEKDRGRRYETAHDLAADLKRHLANEPVTARPPKLGYKIQKAWRRNKMAFSATAGVGLALLVGTGLSLWQAAVARRAGKAAETAEAATQRQLYAASMFSAGLAWEENNYRMVRKLLADTGASPGRGFEWYYWQRQTHQNLMSLYGHEGTLRSAVFFPDGQQVVTGSDDQTARVWNVNTGEERLRLSGHAAGVNSVAVSSDGHQIATGSADQKVIIWDATSGQKLITLEGASGPINSIAFSPDGLRVVTGSKDGIGRIWELATQRVIVLLQGHAGPITSVAFSLDGAKVATGSSDRTAKVWRAMDGANLFIAQHRKEVLCVAFSPDGRKIVTGGLDHIGFFWDADTGVKLPLQLVTKVPMVTIGFDREGQRMVTGAWTSTARVWNATNGQPELLIMGHVRGLHSVAISPDGTRVVTAGFDRAAKVWDAGGSPAPMRVDGSPSNSILVVATSPDGKRIATGSGIRNNNGSITGSGDRALQVWDSRTRQKLLSISGHGSGVSSAVFSPNGARILSGSGDHTAKIWDSGTGALVTTLKGHAAAVTAVAFFPSGDRVVTGSYDQTVRVWNLATGLELFIITGHADTISSVAISSDEQQLVTGSFDQTARLWNAANGRFVRAFAKPGSRIHSVAFSPDNRRLAICGWEPQEVWDLGNTNRSAILLPGHSAPVSSVAFSPDGSRLVTASLDETAKVWEADTGRELLTLRGHTDYVYSAAFSANGQQIVTAGMDRAARLWDAATPEQVAAWEVEEQRGVEKVKPH